MADADVSYPANLRGAIQSTQQRGQEAGYRQSDPAAGPVYFERFSDNVPTIWRFDLRFYRRDAAFFWSWLKSEANNGAASFNMPLSTENDHLFTNSPLSHNVHFTAGGFPQLSSETRDVLTYRCEVIGDINQPVSSQNIYNFYSIYDGNLDQGAALDRAVNINWPS